MTPSSRRELDELISQLSETEKKELLERASEKSASASKRGRRLGLISLGVAFLLGLRLVEPAATITVHGQEISSIKSLNSILLFVNIATYMLAAWWLCIDNINSAIISRCLKREYDEPNLLLAYVYGAQNSQDIALSVWNRAKVENDFPSIVLRKLIMFSMFITKIVLVLITLFPILVNTFAIINSEMAFGTTTINKVIIWVLVIGQFTALFACSYHYMLFGAYKETKFAPLYRIRTR